MCGGLQDEAKSSDDDSDDDEWEVTIAPLDESSVRMHADAAGVASAGADTACPRPSSESKRGIVPTLGESATRISTRYKVAFHSRIWHSVNC